MKNQTNTSLLGKNVEYRIREIKRYVVTRHEHEVHEDGTESSDGSRQLTGEYPNWDTAYAVGYALCRAEHERLGYPIDDMRIQYPVSVRNGTSMSLDEEFHTKEEMELVGNVFVNSEGDIESTSD